jgi:glycosyltransferase involved in cell wall biosynthesis
VRRDADPPPGGEIEIRSEDPCVYRAAPDPHPVLAVVVPCFNEEDVLPETARRLRAVVDGLTAAAKISRRSFILFVDDGSRDRTWETISGLNRRDPAFKGIKLSRNTGHQNALLAGLMGVMDGADAAVSIDADLQDDPAAMAPMVDRFLEGCDVVYGVRKGRRRDNFLKRGTALLFYRLMRLMGVGLVYNHADYRLMSRRVLEGLAGYREVNLFLRGILPTVGFRSATVEYDRGERLAGESKYPFRKMAAFAFDGITSFSIVPLRLVTVSGTLIFLASMALSAWVLVSAFRGRVVPGWSSTVLPIYFIGGIQLMGIGLLGEYIGKIYQEVKGRPRYIIESEIR